jgi:Tol biopolymer transport system component
MPDGRPVAFDSSDGTARTIRQKAADGTGPTTVLVQAPSGYPDTVSPDGRFLVYHTQANVGMVQPLDPGGPSRVLVQTRAQAFNADLSPDGHWIAYQSDESGRFEIYVQPFPAMDAGRWQVSSAGGAHPLWARNGQELFFIDGRGTLTSAPVQAGSAFSYGKPTGLFPAGQYAVNTARNYDVSLDGTQFLFVKTVTVRASPLVHRREPLV